MTLGSYKEQTAVQDAETIRIGSVKMEIGPYGGGLTDVGALRGATFKEGWSDVIVKSDNAGTLHEGITDHIVEVAGEWFEINVANLGIAFAGLGTADVVAAAPVSITDEAVALNDYDLTELLHKNGDGSEVGSIVVADAAAAAVTYVRDCDYVVVTKADGHTAIARAYPTVIEGASALIAAASLGNTYTLSTGSWDVQPAVGDHIYVAGFTEPANNGVKTVTAVTDTVITVAETLTTEAEGDTITIVRGAIQDGATVYVDYDYTPLTSRTYTTGGKTSKAARTIRLTNYDVDDKEWVMTIYKAYIMDGLNLVFPPDDDPNPMPCPIRFVGRIDSSRAAGDQLFGIVDSQDTT
jgi:hypothetical protein